MASYQQRIPLKGTEDSIDYFTDILKSTKDQVGVNSAEVLLRAMVFWHHKGGFRYLNTFPTSASKRNNGRVSRIFYLQVLTTPDIMEQINTELDRVRRGYALKSLLDTQNVGRAEFLLEALIFILEVFKMYRTSSNRWAFFCILCGNLSSIVRLGCLITKNAHSNIKEKFSLIWMEN